MAEQALKWDATDYAKQSSAQQKWAEELFAKLSLSGSEQILDLGCGDGKISANIAKCLPHGNVVGMDASDSMISLALEMFADLNNIVFHQGDATNFSYNGRFNVIFSNAVLHWLSDHEAVLRNCYRSLQAHGKILLQMGGKGNAKEFIDNVTEVTNKEKWIKYFDNFIFPFHFFAIEDYRHWLNKTGFTEKRIELVNKDMQHVGKEGLAGWFRTTWMPYTNKIPEYIREEFISDVVGSYLNAHPIDSSGNTHVNMVRLEVEATKI